MRVLTKSPEETITTGRRLGRSLKAGQNVCLFGDLGAGKTTFIKGIAEAFGIDRREVTSASFIIVSEHKSKPPLYHIDLYRLKDDTELESAGVSDYIGSDGVSVIEWAEKLDHEPADSITVKLNFVSENEREIIIKGISDADWNSS